MADLEAALRRAACWAVPRHAEHRRPAARRHRGQAALPPTRRPRAELPGGEEVRVALSPAPSGSSSPASTGDCGVTASADLPPHLVERAG